MRGHRPIPGRAVVPPLVGLLVLGAVFAVQYLTRESPPPPGSGTGAPSTERRDAPGPRPAPQPGPVRGGAAASDVGFRSRASLEEHFQKHGREFGGAITIDEYLRRAQALRDAPVGGPVLEIRRDDGVISRFDRRTGDFIAFNPDRTIRTFFRPNDGEAYFRRQAERRRSGSSGGG